MMDTHKVALCAATACVWWAMTVALYAAFGFWGAVLPQAAVALGMSLLLARDLWRLG